MEFLSLMSLDRSRVRQSLGQAWLSTSAPAGGSGDWLDLSMMWITQGSPGMGVRSEHGETVCTCPLRGEFMGSVLY